MLRFLFACLLRLVTQATPAAGGISPLANALRDHSTAITALQANGQTNIIDPATGDCVVMIGPDLSHAPMGVFGKTPSMASTGLSGAGLAYYDSGTSSWKKLNS